MFKILSKLFLKIMGWTYDTNIPPECYKKAVVLAVPHTSNWDFPFCAAILGVAGIKMRYTVKREWMRFPMSLIMGPLGAIPIDRRPKSPGEARPSTVEAITEMMRTTTEDVILVIPPEGSRSLREEWRTGFYHIAQGANLPIVCGYLDFKNKIGGMKAVVYPTGDMEADMRKIMEIYEPFKDKGKFPEKFSLDKRYIG